MGRYVLNHAAPRAVAGHRAHRIELRPWQRRRVADRGHVFLTETPPQYPGAVAVTLKRTHGKQTRNPSSEKVCEALRVLNSLAET